VELTCCPPAASRRPGLSRTCAGMAEITIAFSEDDASGAEPNVVPAKAGTSDWVHRTPHPLSLCPSIVEALRSRNSCHRLYSCPRHTMDSFARRRVFHCRRLPRKPPRSLGRISWSAPNIAVVLRYKRLSPCFISSPRDEARRLAVNIAKLPQAVKREAIQSRTVGKTRASISVRCSFLNTAFHRPNR
jgi:hypothetical protein